MRNVKYELKKTQDVIFFQKLTSFQAMKAHWDTTFIQRPSKSGLFIPPPSRCNFIENPANRNAPAWWTETKDMDVFMYIDDYL